MKKCSIYLLLSVIILSVGCQKEDDPTPTSSKPDATAPDSSNNSGVVNKQDFQHQLAKKWSMNTASPSGRQQKSSAYVSIEFTLEGRYYIEKSMSETMEAGDSFITGTYTISEDRRTITLADFGSIEVISISEKSFAFQLTTLDQPTMTEDVTSVASDPVVLSDSDQFLLGEWSIPSFYYIMSGDTIRSTNPIYKLLVEYSEFPKFDTINVHFTQYGTYFAEYSYEGSVTSRMKNYWEWSDDSEKAICFGDWSITLDDRSSICNGSNNATIQKVNDDHFRLTQIASTRAGSFVVSYDLYRAE